MVQATSMPTFKAVVDLRSSQNFSPPSVCDELYQAVLTEIVEVLVSVCKTHRIPLAQTWAPCHQQGHAGENYARCVSSASLVSDLELLGFHEACSQHHLFRGQGIVGAAFTTNKPCFATDTTSFDKTEYPLSHHARMFGLRAAVAIPLRSISAGSFFDFVLELFLPKDCQDPEEQKQISNSLSFVIQQACDCKSLRVIVEKELEEDRVMLPTGDQTVVSTPEGLKRGSATTTTTTNTTTYPVGVQSSGKESSWVDHMMEAQQQGRGVSASLDYLTEEPDEEFRVTPHGVNLNHGDLPKGKVSTDFGQLQKCSGFKESSNGGADSHSFDCHSSSGARKAGEKRTGSTENISLPVLRQYFAGSLKDAAKSIGVCPTTLKRICRQHGITRWPSRKIKKVGHSLMKLQLMIDSVEGADGAIQIGSFYSSIPQLNSPKFPGNNNDSSSSVNPSKQQYNQHLNSQSNSQLESGIYNHGLAMKPPSSMSSQASALHQHKTNTFDGFNGDSLITEDTSVILNGSCSSDRELLASSREENQIMDQTLPPLPENNVGIDSRNKSAFRVKVNFGDKKIRFSLIANSSFRELQLEIMKRFNLDDIAMIDIKYLDDDRDWILLTCDADLQECFELHSQSQNHKMRLCLQQTSSEQRIEASHFESSSSSHASGNHYRPV
ncbi:protein NLP2-like [Humulus lupulus]|uniref:protein NLP2-like n=1 Tax=Humulus lupulus TaxID=3486 RepID=UPI002B4097EA|nr:protein NLP2-like [Humulus lupulus]